MKNFSVFRVFRGYLFFTMRRRRFAKRRVEHTKITKGYEILKEKRSALISAILTGKIYVRAK